MTLDLDLGAHLTVAKTIPAGMDLARRVDATCFQFFTRNPRGGRQRVFPEEEIAAGHARRAQTGLRTLIGHTPYTLNLAADEAMRDFAVRVLAEDLRLCDRIGADLLVTHPGWHRGSGAEAGLERVASLVREALDGYDGRTRLLFEGMAGGAGCLGVTPADLARLVDACGGGAMLGICLDSCHLFAAGWDLRTPPGVDAMVREFLAALGPGRLACVHLNDCRSPLGSGLDRHERIGRGGLGPEGVRAVATHPVLATLPLCLETPVDTLDEYADEIAAVRRFVAGDLAPGRP